MASGTGERTPGRLQPPSHPHLRDRSRAAAAPAQAARTSAVVRSRRGRRDSRHPSTGASPQPPNLRADPKPRSPPRTPSSRSPPQPAPAPAATPVEQFPPPGQKAPHPACCSAPRKPAAPAAAGHPGRGGPRPGGHLGPRPVGGDEGRPSQARPRTPLRPSPPLRHPGPPPLVPHRRLRGPRHRRREGHRAPRPRPPPRPLDAAMADTAETLLRCWLHAAALESRDGRHEAAAPLGPGHGRPGARTYPPHPPQGAERRRGPTGVRAHRAPRTPGHRPGVDGRALAASPRSISATPAHQTEQIRSPWNHL